MGDGKENREFARISRRFEQIIGDVTAFRSEAKVVGAIWSFDEKTVSVENEENRYEVPKDFVGEKSLKAGNKIEITLSHEQVEKIKIEKKKAAKK